MPEILNLQGRKILIISPKFFGYEQRIVERLGIRGAQAVHVDDRPSNSVFAKIFIRLNAALVGPWLESYHRSVINRLQGTAFDDLLFIVPESCSVTTIQRYRDAFPGARILLYMWDSFQNKKRRDLHGFLRKFDKVCSFDRQDCQAYGMKFRPLFFCDTKAKATHTGGASEYDLSFIGTIHSDRFGIIKALGNDAHDLGLRTFIYPFLPSLMHYGIYKLTKREFKTTDRSDLNFVPLPYQEVLRVMAGSTAIVDIEHPDQRGLTMRTLEVIGSGRKLITTNRQVLDYPFYSPDRIQLIDRRKPRLDPDFFKTEAPTLDPEVLYHFSIDGWLDDLLDPS